MFVKPLFAAAAAVITSFTVAPIAEAGLNHRAIIDQLHSIGVSTHYGECGSSQHGEVLGQYDRVDNHLCISDAIETVDLFEETVTHELVHVIQDCIGKGIVDDSMGSITRWISDGDTQEEDSMDDNLWTLLKKANKVDHVNEWTSHMPPELKWVEIEAYALENSPLFVVELLNSCRG